MTQRPPDVRLRSHVKSLVDAKRQRDGAAYPQREISMMTGLSETTVSRLVAGSIGDVTLARVVALAMWLGVSVDAMYEVMR